MRLDRRQFDLLTLTIVLVLSTHVGHLPLWANLAAGLLVGCRWLQRSYRPALGAIPVWLRLPLTLGLPVAVIAQFGTVLGLEPGSVLAIGMLVLKLGESEKVRDARAALTFAGFILMAALLFDQGLLGALHVAAAVGLVFLCLRELEVPPGEQRGPLLGRELLGGARAIALSVAAAVPLTLLVFLFLPRLAQPLWGAPDNLDARTGVSEVMTPGQFQSLMIDDSPAFRVQFATAQPPPPQQRYWRGLVLNRFDGLNWTRTDSSSQRPVESNLQLLSAPLDYEVTMEPTQQRWLFPLDVPTAAPERFLRNVDLTLTGFRPIGAVQRFSMSSALEFRLVGLNPSQRQNALALPYGYNPRAQALGAQWREQYGGNPERIAGAAMKLFRDEFSYTLTPPPLGRNGMDDFIFETKAGYCEYFASAFAILLRSAGVPARVVVGYQGGFWNPTGEYLLVRQSDAHAWNEVWLGERGWVRMDPTAAVRPERVSLGSRAAAGAESRWYRSEWLMTLRDRWDLVNQLWNQVVVQFDTLRQQGLLRQFGVAKADWNQLALAFAIGTSLLLGLALWWALRAGRDRQDLVDRAYAALCRRLRRAGVERAAHEGPAAYLQRLRAALPQSAAELEPLFDDYIRLRYARRDADTAESRRFAQAARRFRPRRNPR